jgi:DNA helicase-2/ATP-dependent DNA helicase PcrA
VIASLRPAARGAIDEFVTLVHRLRAAAVDAAVDELLRDLVQAIRYADHLRAEGPEGQERIENVREMIAGAAEVVADEGGEVGLTPLDHFLQSSTLVAGIDKLDPNADAVVCMTMHNAKGLEFPLVFVCGLEDGLFPLARASEDPSQLEEERRLFYVGITRAEEKLYLTCAEQRRRNGELMVSMPSRFLKVITPSLAERGKTARAKHEGRGGFTGLGSSTGGATAGGGPRRSGGPYGSSAYADRPNNIPFETAPPGGFSAPNRRDKLPNPEDESQDAPSFMPGERVKHAKFGSGTIAELTGTGRDMKVRIDFDDEEIGRKTLVLAQAKLEKGWD